MSTVARRVAAVPARTSTATWHAICALLAPGGDPARTRVDAVADIAAMLIAEEYSAQAPIIVRPAAGDRIRVYTVHGEPATEALDDEQLLAVWPLQQPGWTISLPCGEADLAAVAAALTPHPGFTVRDLATGTDGNTAVLSAAAPHRSVPELDIDLEELRRS